MRVVCEPVHYGIGHDRIREDGRPVRESPIGGQEDRPEGVALIDDRVEALRRAIVDLPEGKVIDHEQIGLDESSGESLKQLREVCPGNGVEEVVKGVKVDREILPAGGMGDCLGQMGLPCSRGAEQEEVFAFLDEATGGQVP